MVVQALSVALVALGLAAVFDLPGRLFHLSIFPQQYLGAFWGLATALTFLTQPVSTDRGIRWYDWALAGLSLWLGVHLAWFYPDILETIGLLTPERTVYAAAAVVLVMESTRRLAGWPLVLIVAAFLLYGRFGEYFPGALATTGLAWDRLADQLFYGTDFMLGAPLRIAILVVFAFILFGQVLFGTGGGEVFMNLAASTMGRYRGGPAKAAVAASALFGSISGSAVANVASTGVITIPLMKRTGYNPTFAGAVEAVASTGGAIMPPVMGAAAFVMTEFLGIPYSAVVLAALVPALAYYATLLIQVDLRALRIGLKGLPPDELPALAPVLRAGWVYLIPIAVLIGAIFFLDTDVAIAALYACASNIVLVLLLPGGWARLRPARLLQMCVDAAQAMLQITVVCAAAGFVVGLVSYTGLGVSLAQTLVGMAGGSLLLLALYTAAASIVLGMGMPATACYILVAVLMAPALVAAGVEPILAHLFVFYFGNFSFLTPPVALAVYAAASISGAAFMASCWQAVRLALAGYIVPFILLYKPGMALIGSAGNVALALFDTAVAVVLLAVAIEGYWRRPLGAFPRLAIGAAALLMFVPGWESRVAGLAIALPLLWFVTRSSGPRPQEARSR
ncbi:MAG TPA: TRAP transporter fused permease subunit [Burkholderiales bacterium]|nr:TRAP transporter fused permease subunit [Burkholderiales bacterium]